MWHKHPRRKGHKPTAFLRGAHCQLNPQNASHPVEQKNESERVNHVPGNASVYPGAVCAPQLTTVNPNSETKTFGFGIVDSNKKTSDFKSSTTTAQVGLTKVQSEPSKRLSDDIGLKLDPVDSRRRSGGDQRNSHSSMYSNSNELQSMISSAKYPPGMEPQSLISNGPLQRRFVQGVSSPNVEPTSSSSLIMVGSQWQCRHCTFVNSGGSGRSLRDRVCEVCQLRQVEVPPLVYEEPSRQKASALTANYCTLPSTSNRGQFLEPYDKVVCIFNYIVFC